MLEKRRLKFALLGAGVVLAMGLILSVGLKGSGGLVYYVTVTEFRELEDPAATGGIRVNGRVVEGTIERMASGEDVAFTMSDGTTSLAVEYSGIIPDTFVDRADVVVEGHLESNGVFVAGTLLAKCPSKYEAADDYEPHEPTNEPAAPEPAGERQG